MQKFFEQLGGLLAESALRLVAGGIPSVFFLMLAALLFIPIESLLGAERPRSLPRRRRVERVADMVHALFNPALAGATAVLVASILNPRLAERLLRPLFDNEIAGNVGEWLSWLQAIGRDIDRDWHLPLGMLLSAFFGYWLHRALHSWGPLWRLHAVHHSSERVDWLSAHRQHPVEVMLIVVATVLPAVLIGLAPKTIAGVMVFQKLHLFLSHASTRLPFGPLRFVIVTPRHHHWHHEKDARCNYAGLFPWLDMIFGTYRYEHRFPAITGTSDHVHKGWFAHLLHPLRRRRHVESDLCWCREQLDAPLYGRAAEQRLQRDIEASCFAERNKPAGTRAETHPLRQALSHVVTTG